MNVVVSTSKVFLSWGRTFFRGLGAYCLRCSTERTLSGRSVLSAAVQFLLFHRFVSKRHNPFVNYFLHVLFQEVIPSRHQEPFLSNLGKALFVTLASKFFPSGQKLPYSKYPRVDRLCPVLARQCRKKNDSAWCERWAQRWRSGHDGHLIFHNGSQGGHCKVEERWEAWSTNYFTFLRGFSPALLWFLCLLGWCCLFGFLSRGKDSCKVISVSPFFCFRIPRKLTDHAPCSFGNVGKKRTMEDRAMFARPEGYEILLRRESRRDEERDLQYVNRANNAHLGGHWMVHRSGWSSSCRSVWGIGRCWGHSVCLIGSHGDCWLEFGEKSETHHCSHVRVFQLPVSGPLLWRSPEAKDILLSTFWVHTFLVHPGESI